MDLKTLQRMTVPKLREEAMNLPDVSGVRGMSKEELIRALAKAHGVDLSQSHRGGSDKSEIKKQIRELQARISEAIQTKAPDADLRKLRRHVKRLKARTRRLAKAPAPAPSASATEGSSTPPPAS